MFNTSPDKQCAIRTLAVIMIGLIMQAEISAQSTDIVPPPTPPLDSSYIELITTQEDQRQAKIEEFLNQIKSSCLTAHNHSKFILQLTVSTDGSNDGYTVVVLDSIDQSLNHSVQKCISGKLEDPNLNFGAIDFVRTARRRPERVQYTLPLN